MLNWLRNSVEVEFLGLCLLPCNNVVLASFVLYLNALFWNLETLQLSIGFDSVDYRRSPPIEAALFKRPV